MNHETEHDTEGVDVALVDWRATAENLQGEVTQRDRTLKRIATWVADMRARDWTVYPGAYGAGKASVIEDVAHMLAADPVGTAAAVAADDELTAELAARFREYIAEHGTGPAGVLGPTVVLAPQDLDEQTLNARARLRRYALLLRQGSPFEAALRMGPEAFGALIAEALGPDGDDR